MFFNLFIGWLFLSFIATQTPAFEAVTTDNKKAAHLMTAGRDIKHARLDCNTWRGLTPLVSVRADVERILGRHIRTVSGTYHYESKAEKVTVVYSTSPCELTSAGRWNVQADTVLELKVYPQKRVKLEDLNLDMSKYVRSEDSHIPEWVYYVNPTDGITIESSTRFKPEEVMSIEYRGRENQRELRCSNPPKP